MTRKSAGNHVALAMLAAIVAACTPGPKGGTDVGNGATVSVKLKAYEPTAKGAQGLRVAGGDRVDELYMVVGRVRLTPGDMCQGDDGGIDLEGPIVSDLLTGRTIAGTSTFTVDPGPICRFKFEFEKLEHDKVPPGAPPELTDRSIVLRGVRADGVPFRVASSLGMEFEMGARNGSFELVAGADPLFLAFDLAPWIDALDLANASGDPILIDDQHDQQRLQAFDDAVKASGRLFRDENDDGQLSSNEQGPDNQLTD